MKPQMAELLIKLLDSSGIFFSHGLNLIDVGDIGGFDLVGAIQSVT